MKICVINSIYSPERRGGAEIMAERIATGLVAAGHDVFVITCGRADIKEMRDGITVNRLKPRNIFNFLDINSQPAWKRAIWHILDQFNFANAKKVEDIIFEEKPDLVLTHNLKGLGYQVATILASSELDWIHTLHDVQLAVPSGLIIKGMENSLAIRNPYNWIYAAFNRMIFSKALKVISPSQWLLDFYYQRRFFKKSVTYVVPNPMLIDQPLKEKNFNFTFAFHGQIEEHKGITLLLSSFEKFVQKYSQAKLIVSGDGRLLPQLQEKYQGKRWVEFIGHTQHNELPEKVFGKASFLIVPSLCYENSPGIIYAAFLNSTPVLAARIGGIAELVEDGVNGYVFRAGDENSLLASMELAVGDAATGYGQMNVAAYDCVQEYSLENYLQKLFAIAKIRR